MVKAYGRNDNGMETGKIGKKSIKGGGLEVNTAGILYIRGIQMSKHGLLKVARPKIYAYGGRI